MYSNKSSISLNLNQDPKDEDDEIKSLMKNLNGTNQNAANANKTETRILFDETNNNPIHFDLNNSAMDPNISINNEQIPLIKLQKEGNSGLKLMKVESSKISGSLSMKDPLSSAKKQRVKQKKILNYLILNPQKPNIFRLVYFSIRKQ